METILEPECPVEHFNTEATFIRSPGPGLLGQQGYCLAWADDHGDGNETVHPNNFCYVIDMPPPLECKLKRLHLFTNAHVRFHTVIFLETCH